MSHALRAPVADALLKVNRRCERQRWGGRCLGGAAPVPRPVHLSRQRRQDTTDTSCAVASGFTTSPPTTTPPPPPPPRRSTLSGDISRLNRDSVKSRRRATEPSPSPPNHPELSTTGPATTDRRRIECRPPICDTSSPAICPPPNGRLHNTIISSLDRKEMF